MGRKRTAVVLAGASALAWNPGFLDELSRREAVVLAVEEPGARFGALLRERPRGLVPVWASPAQPAAGLASLIAAAADGGHAVCGVLALREDWVRWAALAADFFGLPSIGLRAAQVCRDKLLQRLYLSAWSPRFRVISPADRAGPDGPAGTARHDGPDIGFPAVLKPTQRSASSGVRCVRDQAELRSWLAQYGPDEVVLLEEAVTGPEYSVEALVQGGRQLFESVTAKRTNEEGGQFFVELGHSVPAADLTAAQRQALLTANREILRVLGVRDGIVHAEFRLASGRVVLMEVNARLPGDSIPTLYRLATGASLETALIQIALGEPASYPPPRRYARQVYLEHPPGVLKDVRVNSSLKTEPLWLADVAVRPEPTATPAPAGRAALRLVTVIKQRGESLAQITDSRDRAVTFIIDAPSPGDLDAFEQTVRAGIQVEVVSA